MCDLMPEKLHKKKFEVDRNHNHSWFLSFLNVAKVSDVFLQIKLFFADIHKCLPYFNNFNHLILPFIIEEVLD